MARIRISRYVPLVIFSLALFSVQAQQQETTAVLVIGGSTGGTAAGIQCARMGVKTLIVEPTPWLGGMLSAAGVSCTDGNDEMPGGIWQEFREELYRHYRTRNLFAGWVSETCFEPHVADSIFKAWVSKEPHIRVLYGWYFHRAVKKGNRVTGAEFINRKGERMEVKAELTIDASDLGDVFASAGAGFDLGMEDKSYSKESMAPGRNNMIQDLTLVAILKDYGKGNNQLISRPANYDSTRYFCSCTDAPCPNGKPYQVNAAKMLEYGRLPNGKFMINWPAHGNDYYINIVSAPPIRRDSLLMAARDNTLGFVYFIQTSLGLGSLGLYNEFGTPDQLAWMPYHREGRRLRGLVRLNVNHILQPFSQTQKLYRTGISVGDYPVDHHHSSGKNPPSIEFPRVPSFNIPLGALIPAGIEGLIVCEKGISVSNIANGSTRLQPCVLLTGQAAGILAALTVTKKTMAARVPVREVQSELLSRKAYLMPYFDVRPTDPHWSDIQKIGATGILKGTGKPEGWANKTYFYPDSLITEKQLADGLQEFEPSFSKKDYVSGDYLTVSRAWKMITYYHHLIRMQKNIPHKYPPVISEEWKQIFKESGEWKEIKGGDKITRAQVAVLLNALADSPFNEPVDIYGKRMPAGTNGR